MKADLSCRADQYIAEIVSSTGDGSNISFTIPPGGKFSIVQEKALHTWAESKSGGQLILSYEQLKRVCDQIFNYPLRKQWALDVGNKWTVKRNGELLLLEGGDSDNDVGRDTTNHNGISWILTGGRIDVDVDGPEVLRKHIIRLSLPDDNDKGSLIVKYVGGNERHKFVPPWREGRSPIKIKDFLRGQKVPLHKRETTPILCFADDTDTVVAVYVEDGHDVNGGWVVHADFETANVTTGEDSHAEMHVCIMQVAS